MLPIRVRLRQTPDSYGYIVHFFPGFMEGRAVVCWDGGAIETVNISALEHMGIREEPTHD